MEGAQAALLADGVGTAVPLRDYREHLEDGELALAMEELELVGVDCGSVGFWHCLMVAARPMNVQDKAVQYTNRLARARRDPRSRAP